MNEEGFLVMTKDGDPVRISDCIAGTETDQDTCEYAQHGHLLIGIQKRNTPKRELFVSIYFVLNPKTDIFMFAGMTTAGLDEFDFKVEVLGSIANLHEGGARKDGLNKATFTLATL